MVVRDFRSVVVCAAMCTNQRLSSAYVGPGAFALVVPDALEAFGKKFLAMPAGAMG